MRHQASHAAVEGGGGGGGLERVLHADLNSPTAAISESRLRLPPDHQTAAQLPGDGSPLQHLTLSCNDLQTISLTDPSLAQLESLSLFNNRLSRLPNGLRNITSLKALSLDYNHLPDLGEAITALTQLRTLGMYHNKISKVSDAIHGLTHLESLALQHNRISHLPATFSKLSSLTDLQLTHNRISSVTWLPPLTGLVRLGLSHNGIRSLPPDLHMLHKLTTVAIAHNKLDTLPASLLALPSLTTLTASHNRIGPHLTHPPLTSLLRHLDVSTNNITELPRMLCGLSPLLHIQVYANPLPEHLLLAVGNHGLAGLRAIHRAELSELVPCSHLSLVLSATPQAGGTQFVSSLASERGKESSDPSHAVSSFASSAHAAIAAATSGVAGTCLVRATIPITHASGAYRGDVPLTSPKDTNKDGTIPPPLLGHAALLPLSQRAETLARFVPPPNGLSDGLALLIGSLKDGMAERWMERKLADLHRAVPSGSSSKRSVLVILAHGEHFRKHDNLAPSTTALHLRWSRLFPKLHLKPFVILEKGAYGGLSGSSAHEARRAVQEAAQALLGDVGEGADRGGTPAAPRAAAKVHAVLRKAASPVHTWQQVRQLAASELALGHPLAEPQEAIADELILIASVRSLERSGALVCSPPLPVNVAASCAPQWVVSNPDWLVRQLSRVAMAASCGPLPRIDRAERTGAPQSASNNEIDVSGSSKSRSNSRSNSTSQRKHRQRLPTPPGSASAGWLRVRHAIGPPSSHGSSNDEYLHSNEHDFEVESFDEDEEDGLGSSVESEKMPSEKSSTSSSADVVHPAGEAVTSAPTAAALAMHDQQQGAPSSRAGGGETSSQTTTEGAETLEQVVLPSGVLTEGTLLDLLEEPKAAAFELLVSLGLGIQLHTKGPRLSDAGEWAQIAQQQGGGESSQAAQQQAASVEEDGTKPSSPLPQPERVSGVLAELAVELNLSPGAGSSGGIQSEMTLDERLSAARSQQTASTHRTSLLSASQESGSGGNRSSVQTSNNRSSVLSGLASVVEEGGEEGRPSHIGTRSSVLTDRSSVLGGNRSSVLTDRASVLQGRASALEPPPAPDNLPSSRSRRSVSDEDVMKTFYAPNLDMLGITPEEVEVDEEVVQQTPPRVEVGDDADDEEEEESDDDDDDETRRLRAVSRSAFYRLQSL